MRGTRHHQKWRSAMQSSWRRSLVPVLALHATLHGGVFTYWASRPDRPRSLVGRSAHGRDENLAKEVQEILDELRLDEPYAEPPSHPGAPSQVPPIPKASSAGYMSAQSLRDQLKAQERRKQALLEEQRLHDLELQQLRQQAAEAAEAEERQWSARPHLPPREAAPLSAPPRPLMSQPADGLLAALRQWGVRQAPELGHDMFVASLSQIKMLMRAQGEQAGRTHVAGLQALQRYVEQLEMDLDAKEEELSSAKSQLREEQQRRTEAQQEEQLQNVEVDAEALKAAQAEVARLEEELANALQGQEEVQEQLQQQVQRAEAAEAKLVNLVERIRGAATARAR